MRDDQATRLRQLAEGNIPTGENRLLGGKSCTTIAITSGKGGVGKSNITINTACALANLGKKVLVLDADFGLANLDVLTGVTARYNLSHVVKGERRISETIITGPAGIQIVLASSGMQEMADMSAGDRERLVEELDSLDWQGDFFLIDTGAGISANVIDILMAVPEVVVVTLPEPTAITDAYAIIKVLSQKGCRARVRLLVNRAASYEDGADVFEKIQRVIKRFLPIDISYFGYVLEDTRLVDAVMRQKAVVEAYPGAVSARCFQELARKLCNVPGDVSDHKGFMQFWKNFLRRDVAFM